MKFINEHADHLFIMHATKTELIYDIAQCIK